MSHKRNKWKDEHCCSWCFLPMDRFTLYFCSDFCKEEAQKYKDREDKLAKGQQQAAKDVEKHNADLIWDAPDDYPLDKGNLND